MEISLHFYACGIVGPLLRYGGDPHLGRERLVRQLELLLKGGIFLESKEK